jgi:hypothetical protein
LINSVRRVALIHLTREDATKAAWFLAAVVGQAHARQMDALGKIKWQEEFKTSSNREIGCTLVAMDKRR